VRCLLLATSTLLLSLPHAQASTAHHAAKPTSHHAAPLYAPTPTIPHPQDDATTLVAALKSAKVAPEALLALYATRIQHRDATLHTIIALNRAAESDAATAAPRAPLYGLPILLKDNIETRDNTPTTAGSLALARNITHRDAGIVARLRDHGAVILGKTNLSEWANFRSTHASSGWSGTGGLTLNPWDTTRTACGSSAGSAAAIAAGFAAAAIGTETDGSITCPAAMNGLVGLKPTIGLVSRSGIVPISTTQDTAGPITRTVSDAALLLTAIAGHDPADPATTDADRHATDYTQHLTPDALRGKRIGILRFAEGSSPAVKTIFEQALTTLRAEGAILIDIPAFDSKTLGDDELTVLLAEFHDGIDHYLATTPPSVTTRTLKDLIAFNATHAQQEMPWFDQDIFERALKTPPLTDATYKTAKARAHQLAGPDGIDAMLAHDHLDALVAPTIGPAWVNDLINGDRPGDKTGAGTLAAVAGYPHLTVPMGHVRTLPVGLSFLGPAWSEARLLQFGYAYEHARGPWQAPPAYRN